LYNQEETVNYDQEEAVFGNKVWQTCYFQKKVKKNEEKDYHAEIMKEEKKQVKDNDDNDSKDDSKDDDKDDNKDSKDDKDNDADDIEKKKKEKRQRRQPTTTTTTMTITWFLNFKYYHLIFYL